MDEESLLRARLRKIEALFAGTSSSGERAAAEEALQRIRRRLVEAQREEAPAEIKFTFPDQWARRLFVALCRRYELKPYRYRRQRHTTVVLRAPRAFIESILWPEFQELHRALNEYLANATERIIRDEVHRDAGEAPEVDEPPQLE